jgi:putative PIN family toxin of toxin-antitoxin system
MGVPQIVLDTNVLVAAFRSRRGASFRLLSLVDAGRFKINVSVPLIFEYEDVLSRPNLALGLSADDIRDVVDYLCTVGNRHEIFYLWRPFLKDPKDDLVLELAVSAGCQYVVTYNTGDFAGSDQFGVAAIEPAAFLREIGELP